MPLHPDRSEEGRTDIGIALPPMALGVSKY